MPSSDARVEAVGSARISLSDRLAAAFVSFFAAAVTAVVLALVLYFRRGSAEPGDWSVFLPASIAACFVAALVGFVAGPERMAGYFGLAWGTVEPNGRHVFLIMVVVLLVCGVVLL